MVLSTSTACHFARHLLAAWASSIALAGAAHAKAPALPTSVFDSYKSYTDESVANWKQANDTTARIGGWREYAKQAQELPSKPANTSIPPATPAAEAIDASVEPLKKAKP